MKNKGLIQLVSDFFLKDSLLDDWLKNRDLRNLYYSLWVCSICIFTYSFIVNSTPLGNILSDTSNRVFWYRVSMSIAVLVCLILLFILTFHYFKYTIEQGNPISFGSVLFFYIAASIYFGLLYFHIFWASPSLFQYDSSRIVWIPIISQQSSEQWSAKFYFLLYGAFESIGGNFAYLQSNSILVSIINYVQSLYSFSLVSLLVAGYINQKTNKPA